MMKVESVREKEKQEDETKTPNRKRCFLFVKERRNFVK